MDDKSDTTGRSETHDIHLRADPRLSVCDKIATHVGLCKLCQMRLSYDPVEKSLLKTNSIHREIIELIAFIVMGVVVIVSIHILTKR